MLKPLKLKNVSVADEKAKLKEEYSEFLLALIEGDKNHIIEEFYDLMQVGINLMNMQRIDTEDIRKGKSKHYEKMIDRDYEVELDFKEGDYIVYNDKIYLVNEIGRYSVFLTHQTTDDNYNVIDEETIAVDIWEEFRKLPF